MGRDRHDSRDPRGFERTLGNRAHHTARAGWETGRNRERSAVSGFRPIHVCYRRNSESLRVEVRPHHPPRMAERKAVQYDVRAVLMFQPELKNLELKCTDHADDRIAHSHPKLLEDLNRAFLRQLREAAFQLFATQGIFGSNDCEMLGRKSGHALEFECTTLAQGIANPVLPRIK